MRKLLPALLCVGLLAAATTAQAAMINQYDASTDTWDDQVGSADLSPQGGAAIAVSTGYFSKAFTFDGDGDYATGASTSGDIGDNPFSVEMWVKFDALTDSTDEYQIIWESGGKFGILVALSKDGMLHFDVGSRNNPPVSETTFDLTSLSGAEKGNFIHIVGVNDADTNNADGVQLYVNGTSRDTDVGNVNFDGGDDSAFGYGSDGGTVNKIGTWKNEDKLGDPEELDGAIALAQIYNHALTATEVENNYNAVIPEPATLALLGLGGLGVLLKRRRTA